MGIVKTFFFFSLQLGFLIVSNIGMAQVRTFEGYKGHEDKSFTVYSERFAKKYNLPLENVDTTLHPNVQLIDFQFTRQLDQKGYDRSDMNNIKEIKVPDYRCTFHMLIDDGFGQKVKREIFSESFGAFNDFTYPLVISADENEKKYQEGLMFTTMTAKGKDGPRVTGIVRRMTNYLPRTSYYIFLNACVITTLWTYEHDSLVFNNWGNKITIPQLVSNKVIEWGNFYIQKEIEGDKRWEARKKREWEKKTFFEKLEVYWWRMCMWFISLLDSIQN